MKVLNIDNELNESLSNKINNLINKISKKEIVECIYISFFEAYNILNDVYVGIDVIFDDVDYYGLSAESIINYIELYTTAISRIMYKKDLRVSFNINSSKRSDYYKDKSIHIDYLCRSDIVYDKYGAYNKIKNNYIYKCEEFSNCVKFNPELKLKKI